MSMSKEDAQALLPKLYAAKSKLLLGEMVNTIEIPTPAGSTKRLTYFEPKLNNIDAEITRCEAIVAGNVKPTRFAITGG